MGAQSHMLDMTLFRLTMAVIDEMEAKAGEYVAAGGWVPHRRERSVSTFDSGWPSVGALWPGGRKTDEIAYGELFALKHEPGSTFALDDLATMTELRDYVDGTCSLRDRVRIPGLGPKADELDERMFSYEVASLPWSIFDRAKALGSGSDLNELYALRERDWLAPELPYQLIVPLVMTDIEVEGTFEIDEHRRIERLTDDDLRSMANDYDVSGVPGVVANAAKFALVLDMPAVPNPGPGPRFLTRDTKPDTTGIEEVCDALRVLTSQATGWARVFRRPRDWARHWEDDLPEHHLLHTARRYPPSFDDYGWLKTADPIVSSEISQLPLVLSATAVGSDQARLAVRRLSMAQVRDTPDDRLVDACIGLESLLGLKGAEISYRVALRAAALLSTRADDPLQSGMVFKMAKRVYERRSEIVHGGTKTKAATIRLDPGGPEYSTSTVAVWLLRQVLHEGAAARFRDSWLGSLVGGLAHDDLELDRGQSCESGLASATVVGPFDPGHDRDPQLLSGGPSLPVQDVALKQAEEALHGGVVTG